MNLSSKVILLALVLTQFTGARAEKESEQSCREENAARLIKQVKDFKNSAASYHELSKKQTDEAKILIAQARKLEESSKRLHARVEASAKSSSSFTLNASQYKLHLKEFQEHARLYNAHLQDYQKQLARVQAMNGQISSHCKEFADHVQRYHIPGIEPPHVCVQLQWEERDMQTAARNFNADRIKSQKAESELSKQEAELAKAARERNAIESRLLQSANLDELERTQGVMLLKEYQQIEREFRMLKTEKKSIQNN